MTRSLVLDGTRERDLHVSLAKASEVRLRLTQGGETFQAPLSWWTAFQARDDSGGQARCNLQFQGPESLGWHSEALLLPQSLGSLVLTFPRLFGQKGTMELPFEVQPGTSVLVLDVTSGTLMN